MGTPREANQETTQEDHQRKDLPKDPEDHQDQAVTAVTPRAEIQRDLSQETTVEDHLKKDSSNSDLEEAEEAQEALVTVEIANQEIQRDLSLVIANTPADHPRNELPKPVTLVSIRQLML